MSNLRTLFFVSVWFLSCLGCAPEPTPVDTAAAEQAINAVREREISSFITGDVDALAALFTANCQIMPPNEAALAGRDEARAWAEGVSSQFTIDGKYTSSEIDVTDDWAIERYTGVLQLTPKAGGDTVEEHIKGMHIYRRQEDGSWQIFYDVWNSDSPPPVSE